MTTHVQDPASPRLPSSRFWEEEGVFYAELPAPASDDRLCVVLHGVTNPEQASQAISVLMPLHVRLVHGSAGVTP